MVQNGFSLVVGGMRHGNRRANRPFWAVFFEEND